MKTHSWAKRICATILLCLFSVSLLGCGNAAAPEEAGSAPSEDAAQAEVTPADTPENTAEEESDAVSETDIPEAGYAVDENGFCITTGEFFDALETLLTAPNSQFNPGFEVKIENGEKSPEIRTITLTKYDTHYFVNTSMAGGESYPADDEPFTMVMTNATLSTDDQTNGLIMVESAILYLINPEADSFTNAWNFLSEIMGSAGTWVQKGTMEYQYANISGDIYAVVARAASAY